MDEPLSNLDAKLRVATRAELIKLHQRLQTTIVYVTHDQVEAMTMGTRIAVLKDGILQQIDSPQQLYDNPTNIFVAGFIGSPAMNFFNVTVVGTPPDNIWLEGTGFRLKVPGRLTGPLEEYLGKEIVIGLRPEHFVDAAFVSDPAEGTIMPVRVDVVEHLGSEINAYLMAGNTMFVATLDSRSQLESGNSINVVANTERMHAFDKQTERAIR